MKRQFRAVPVLCSRKRRDIDKSEYQPAIDVGKAVLKELHARYPEIFPERPKGVSRSHAYSNHLYVMLNIGVPTHKDVTPLKDIWDYEHRISKEIRDQILPELGISPDDFEVDLSCNDKGRIRYTLYELHVFDKTTNAWEEE